MQAQLRDAYLQDLVIVQLVLRAYKAQGAAAPQGQVRRNAFDDCKPPFSCQPASTDMTGRSLFPSYATTSRLLPSASRSGPAVCRRSRCCRGC